MRQTTVQEANTIRFGSAKVEVGETVETLENLGAMKNVVFEETWDKIKVMSDNAGEVTVGIRNHKAAIGGEMMEISLGKLNIIRGGIDKLETVTEGEGENVVDVAKRLTSGGLFTLGHRVIKITNTNPAGKEFSITIFKATTEEGLNIQFQPDEGEESAMTPMKMEGSLDTSKAPGEQLFEIYDEQGVL